MLEYESVLSPAISEIRKYKLFWFFIFKKGDQDVNARPARGFVERSVPRVRGSDLHSLVSGEVGLRVSPGLGTSGRMCNVVSLPK